jgi:CDP-diglyceride synthetase
LSVAPLNGSTQTVAFSCGSVPSNVSCAFSAPSETLDGKTTATSMAMLQVVKNGEIPALPSLTILRLLTLCLSVGLAMWAMLMAFRIVSRENYPRRFNLAGIFALLLLVFTLASCNGGSRKGTSSTINLTATSGATVHSATVTVTVK